MNDIMGRVEYRHYFTVERDAMETIRLHVPRFIVDELRSLQVGVLFTNDNDHELTSAEFYIPRPARPLTSEFRPDRMLVQGSARQYDICVDTLMGSYDLAWNNYNHQLNFGIAHEVARMCLPNSIYVTVHIPFSSRRIMQFLELTDRLTNPIAPQPKWEFDQVVGMIEDVFKTSYPGMYEAFVAADRRDPRGRL